ncbi:DegT/DnrJ/EryC1/StrS family aminotransferase [Paludibaculum fermentans]|uniref:DegT/DnrJ/EryC1/StrS family aminotransferase n=1 Tax=Paludibaculum fermentans TaxID=1473598 RepID=A0A7S7NMB2_PALFE|nr:DegT/DnrJ/EryC1/StrS family aminotransferase [Paludibaculum fermentans]QOY86194.1 DegT/DnrJ/EryC1/StrS family aminotransferase [Paludibaculum fermentans]
MSQLAILGGDPVRRKPFAPWPQYQPSDIARIVRTVESRHWGGYPLPTALASGFCKDFAAMHGAEYALPVANGTVSLSIALQAAGVGFGDEVIVPAYTWDGTATAVLAMGAVPVFADIDPDTYCLCVESVRQAITPRTKAIIPVHLAMRFTEMGDLMTLAHFHNLKVIEDAAHAHGGAYHGKGAGSIGDMGSFSLQESKLMTAGEGGMLTTNSLEYYEAMQTVVNCGRASLTDKFGQRLLGLNYRMTDLQIALLIGQLETLPALRALRAERAHLLGSLLQGVPGIRVLPEQPGITAPTNYCYVLQYRPEPGQPAPHRDLFVAALEKEGIPCDGRFYEAVYKSDLFYATPKKCPQLAYERETPVDYSQDHCPVSERAAYDESIWLFQFCLIGEEEDVRDVARAIEKVASNLETLSKQDPALAGVKAMGRAQRARFERQKNY